MGWAFGEDEDPRTGKMREVGYGVQALCDFPRCKAKIDRGLGCACGEVHVSMIDDKGCGAYFCSRHSRWTNRVHSWETHVRYIRKERREIAHELLRFRGGKCPAGDVRFRYKVWKFIPGSEERFHDMAAMDVMLASYYHRRAA